MFALLFRKQIYKQGVDDIVFCKTVNGFDAIVAVNNCERINIQNKHRIRNIVEDFMVFFFRLLQLVFKLFALRNIKAHLNGSYDITFNIFYGRRSQHPVDRGSIPVHPALLTVMGLAVFKGAFNRAVGTFLVASFIRMIAIITRPRIKPLGEFVIIAQQLKIPVLDGNQTGSPFKQGLILIPLLIQLGLFLGNFFTHLVDGSRQFCHFIILVDVHPAGIHPLGDGPGSID